MNPKEIVGLVEAYMDVYSPERLDEGILDEGAAGDVADRAAKLARQKKGQTPERKAMYKSLAAKAAERERGPFKGGTTRKNMTSADRDASRESDAYSSSLYGERSKPNQHGNSTYGPGGKPKGKKAERQKARGVSAESYDLYDIILSHLLDEGYADTEETATAIMVNMSEEWKQNIMERDVERGEEDDSRAVRAHNKSLKGKDGKPLYPSGRAGYARRPNPANDPRYGSQR
jgi:hypothetical protein